MLRRLSAVVFVLGFSWQSETLTFAHHSVVVNFDQSKQVAITGTIKDVDFRNPHSQITVTVPAPGGGGTDWFVEWSDKNSLVRRAVPYELLRVGEKVTITLSPSRRLANVGYFNRAVLPDGRTLRDCGFAAFRQSVANGTTVTCEPEK